MYAPALFRCTDRVLAVKVIVFGATGGVGSHVVQFALDAGHEVTVFARTPAKVKSSGAEVVQGDALDPVAVRDTIVGHDAVISALATTAGPGRDTSLRRMGANIAAGMTEASVRRIVWCASEGVDGEMPGLVGWAVQKMLARPLADHRAALDVLEAAGLDLTVARPRALNDGPLEADYVEVVGGPAQGKFNISRASVAHFMVKALDDPAYVGQSVALAARK